MKKKRQKTDKNGFKYNPEKYPASPGCYLMKDRNGRVIYAGKAKNLRRRLSYYFRNRRQYYKTKRMVPRIHDVEVILVNNETESLVLENNLIKHYKPRYNSMLIDDDAGYPFIVLTGEKFPRLLPYRKNWSNRQWSVTEGKEEGRRFGPFLGKYYRDTIMEFAIEKFGLRICRTLPRKVCLRYRLAKCSGICEGLISSYEYDKNVEQAVELLEYRHSDILLCLKEEMECCSCSQNYEAAAKLRDRIRTLESILEKQVVETDAGHDQDVIYFGRQHVMVTEIKKGMLLKARLFGLSEKETYKEACNDFLQSYFIKSCPCEIIVNRQENAEYLEKHFFSKGNTAVKITVPDQGIELDLLMLCKKNYEYRRRNE